eukprot:gene212-3599_t
MNASAVSASEIDSNQTSGTAMLQSQNAAQSHQMIATGLHVRFDEPVVGSVNETWTAEEYERKLSSTDLFVCAICQYYINHERSHGSFHELKPSPSAIGPHLLEQEALSARRLLSNAMI